MSFQRYRVISDGYASNCLQAWLSLGSFPGLFCGFLWGFYYGQVQVNNLSFAKAQVSVWVSIGQIGLLQVES